MGRPGDHRAQSAIGPLTSWFGRLAVPHLSEVRGNAESPFELFGWLEIRAAKSSGALRRSSREKEEVPILKKRLRLKWLSVLVVLLVVAAACGSGDDSESTEETPAPTTAETEPASTEPIKIGALTSLTGNFTPWGVQVRDGMQLAVDEINAAGGVNGVMLELVVADDQSNAEEGVTALERLIEQDEVVAVGGAISSDVGLNTALVAEELQTPLFLVKAGSGAILTQDSRYTFRTCLPAAPMVAVPIAEYAQAQGFTKVGAIIADYGWGRAIESALTDAFDDLPGIDLQIEVAPVPEQDFATYLRSLQEFGPDLIVATGHPPGSGPITVQSADLGFDVPITGAFAPLSLIMGGGVAESAIGRYANHGCADYFSDSYQEMAVRYLASSDNVFMEDDAVAGYGIVTMVADAVEAVGTDGVAIAEYLHGQTYDLPGYAFQMGWTAWGELATAQLLFVTVAAEGAPEGTNDAGTWYPERLDLSDPLEPYVP